MKQPKEIHDATALAPRFRFWSTPPETVCLAASDLERVIPGASRLAPFTLGQSVELPAAEVFASPVPKISLARLAELLPNHVQSGDGKVALPVSALARGYALKHHFEEIIPPQPEFAPPVVEPAPVTETVAIPVPPHTAYEIARLAPVPPEHRLPSPDEPSAIIPPPPMVTVPPPTATQRIPTVPQKRTLPMAGLPLFRRRPTVVEPPASAEDVPPAPRFAPSMRLPVVPPPAVDLAPIEPPPVDVEPESVSSEPPVQELPADPALEPIVEPTTPVDEEPPVYAQPVQPEPAEAEDVEAEPARMLETEHVSVQQPVAEIGDESSLQALFLTEETLTVARVIELCCGLPGIHSCVLAHQTVVVAAHNAPPNIDLVSLSGNASEMLAAMRASSARMGVGSVPAVTLHTEKGVISFFNRDDLTMLVFHKDRGFVPGVREKMVAVLGELTRAHLTLPAGDDQSSFSTQQIS